uniref:leucine--tRNA ligase n=1 Tax=Romanomermis culicivorax TaxID=13658 RepID=A0A915J704_ROMCU
MRQQLKQLGCAFNWEKELSTCDPIYYKWTQWIFVQLFKQGLAYKKKSFVYWDPVDKTVLALEQIDNDGKSWRSGAKAERKLLNQWYIKTTKFTKVLEKFEI